jgi:hypothetical protein
MIVVVMMMATGTVDPVRRAAREAWNATLPTLTIDGSNPDGDGTYCQGAGTKCNQFYDEAIKSQNCQFGPGYSQKEVLDNCTKLQDPAEKIGDCSVCTGLNDGCVLHYSKCSDCEVECFEATITDIKDNLAPASGFVLILMVYLTITVVWNHIMIANETLDGTPKIVGFVLNGLLVALSFFFMVMGTIGLSKASDQCPDSADGCLPDSMIMVLLIGVGVLVVSGAAIAGIQLQNPIMIQISTGLMTILCIFLVLFALILGMSTGVVMDDASYYYDTQYPKLRIAFEKVDNGYCQMTKEECTEMWGGQSAGNGNRDYKINVQSDGEDVLDDDGNKVTVSFRSVWHHMWAVAASKATDTDETNQLTAESWLSDDCSTTGICIYCKDVIENVRTVPELAYDNSCSSTLPTGERAGCRGRRCSNASQTSCITRAPNFDWMDAVVGVPAPSGVVNRSVTADYELLGSGLTFSADEIKAGLTANSLKCQGTHSKGASFADDDVDDNKLCIMPIASDDDDGQFNYRCAGSNGEQQAAVTLGSSLCEGEPTLGMTLKLDSVDSWTDKVSNFTRYNEAAKAALPYCEEAITQHAQDDKKCKDFDEMGGNEKNSYLANCDNCDNPFAPFTFGFSGPEVGYRQCLNFVVGHFRDHCSNRTSAESTCYDALRYDSEHYKYLIDTAYSGDRTSFCGYSDEGCKAKIKWDIEGSMTTVGVSGSVFLFLFLGIIFCTYEAIVEYRLNSASDDDDEAQSEPAPAAKQGDKGDSGSAPAGNKPEKVMNPVSQDTE